MPAKLPCRRLGRNGPEVPALGLGLMGLSSFYGTSEPDEERIKFLDHAHASGCLHWDSAALYGDSEELVGKWFARTGKRKEIFLATKFGNYVDEDGGRIVRNDVQHIHEAVARSLKRLQTDYIDLLYCHRFNNTVPVEIMVQTMKEYVDKGIVKYIGLSECTADTIRRACSVMQVSAYQIEYSPFSMDIESEQTQLLETCRELGVATIAYSPLGRGMLTGQIKSFDDLEEDDFRRTVPRFSKENFPKNMELVDTLQAVAKGKGCTSGQLVLAWMMAQGEDIIPIPGTKRIKYLDENLGALHVTLNEDEVANIRKAIEQTEVHGTRYSAAAMGLLIQGTPPLEEWKG